MFARQLPVMRRYLTTSAVRMDAPGGIPGANLPFSINNKYKLCVGIAVFFGSGFAVPFILLRHQLKKKSG